MARILIGVTGSVAALKLPELVAALGHHEIKIVATRAAGYFFDAAALPAPVITDADEWPGERYQRGDLVQHIELRRWADLFAIVPLDANTLAKLAHGLSDNALTCVWRAWDPTRPVVIAPAMNTLMWDHPLTHRHLRAVAELFGAFDGPADPLAWVDGWNAQRHRLRVAPPQAKLLACGDVGLGAMADVATIAALVESLV